MSKKPAGDHWQTTEAATEAAAGNRGKGDCSRERRQLEDREEAAKPDTFEKNIKIIVPYDAGGGVDITTRILTQKRPEKIILTVIP